MEKYKWKIKLYTEKTFIRMDFLSFEKNLLQYWTKKCIFYVLLRETEIEQFQLK